MISVIIPTYKGAKCLNRAVDSALYQQDVEVEVLVVDDNPPGSEGRADTEQCMRKYEKETSVKYIKHPKNMNGSAARNTGIKAAKGDFISFLDDDDIYIPGRLRKCLNRAEETGVELIYTDVLVTKNNTPSGYIEAIHEGCLFKELWLDENIFGTGSNIFIKKESIQRYGGFNESLPRQQDFEFLLRQFSKGIITAGINECLVIKAMNGVDNSASYEKLKEIKLELLKIFEDDIGKLGEEIQREIYIAQHKELLHSAAINKCEEGMREQRKELSELGYELSTIEKMKYILLKSNMRHFAQNMEWKRRSKEIVKLHPGIMKYIQ